MEGVQKAFSSNLVWITVTLFPDARLADSSSTLEEALPLKDTITKYAASHRGANASRHSAESLNRPWARASTIAVLQITPQTPGRQCVLNT